MNDKVNTSYPGAYKYRRIVKAKRYIDEHFNQPIDLDDISREACFSKYHFIRQFKIAYGKTPWQYLMELRVTEASRLLEKSRHSVTEICFKVGFESVGSFSSLFKKTTGFSPGAFRDHKRQKKHEVSNQPLTVVPHCFATAWLEN